MDDLPWTKFALVAVGGTVLNIVALGASVYVVVWVLQSAGVL